MQASESSSTLSQNWFSKKLSFLHKLESVRPFTQKEAWNLFRLAALAEAFGWTLLILGIAITRYKLPGEKIAVPIAGQIHGMLFVGYFGVLIAVYTSLGWSRKKAIVATIMGVPPYGTLLFEQWAAREQRKITRQSYRRILVRALLRDKKRVLLVQPSDTAIWNLPGGYVAAGETPEAALARIILDITGVKAKIGSLKCVLQSGKSSDEQLEFYFNITNVSDFISLDFASIIKANSMIDEIRFAVPQDMPDLEPAFLRDNQ